MVVKKSAAAEISVKMAQKAKPRTTKVHTYTQRTLHWMTTVLIQPVFTVILVTKTRNVVSIDAYQLMNRKCGSLAQWSLSHFQIPVYIN